MTISPQPAQTAEALHHTLTVDAATAATLALDAIDTLTRRLSTLRKQVTDGLQPSADVTGDLHVVDDALQVQRRVDRWLLKATDAYRAGCVVDETAAAQPDPDPDVDEIHRLVTTREYPLQAAAVEVMQRPKVRPARTAQQLVEAYNRSLQPAATVTTIGCTR
jgi:hypothetical protein